MIDHDPNQHWSTKTAPTKHQDYPSDLLDSLRQHSLFQRTNNEAFLTKLASSMHVRIYNPRDIIINKGESSKAMFFLLRGQVDVCSADFERIYATLTQGSCFGEIGILYAMPRTASVVATSKCTVAALTSDQVHTLLPQFPVVDKIIRFEAEERLAIMNKMDSRRNDYTNQQQQATTMMDGRQRASSVQYNVEAFSKTGLRTHLDKIPFFFDCSDDFLHLICLSIRPRNYGPNTVIFNQSDQGDEMYFIIDGFVDIEKNQSGAYGRLGPGGYFGDTSVLLNLPRPATVKTVTQMECYILDRTNLQQVCDQFPDHGKRLKALTETRLNEITKGNFDELSGSRPITMDSIQSSLLCRTTCDQDPTLPMNPASQLRTTETRRRRPSIAVWNDPFLMEISQKATFSSEQPGSPPTRKPSIELPPSPSWATSTTLSSPSLNGTNDLPVDRLTTMDTPLLLHLTTFLDFATLIEMMRLNTSTYALFSHDKALQHMNLSTLHKKITDDTFAFLMSFLRHRLHSLSLSQCFHLTDLGFRSLFFDDTHDNQPLQHLHSLNLNSCWLLTDQSLQLIGERCPHLVRLDLSNCRKLTNNGMYGLLKAHRGRRLRWLSLSYCKNLTDTTMRYLADYTGDSLEYLNLQRCTKITDAGFQHWQTGLGRLKELVLADCSFLTDGAIHRLVDAAVSLERVVLSFCCSLSDGVVTALARLAYLTELDLSYCGAAVSDLSLSHLPLVQRLNLRGCVRITGQGILKWLDHHALVELNISQCPSISSDTKQYILDGNLVQHLIL